MSPDVTYCQVPLSAEERREAELTATACGVSLAEAMRMALRFGLPRVRESMARDHGRVTMIEPLSEAEWAQIYSRGKDDHGYAVPELMATQVFPTA